MWKYLEYKLLAMSSLQTQNIDFNSNIITYDNDMGAPPYCQVPIWHADFIGKGTCPAAKGTARCRNRRTCDRVGHGRKDQKLVAELRDDLVYCYEQYSQEDRTAVANSIAKWSICAGCGRDGKREEVRNIMLEQLEEWNLKRRDFADLLPVTECEEEDVEEELVDDDGEGSSSSSSPFSLTLSSQHGSSPPADPSTLTLDSSPPTLPPIVPFKDLEGFFFKTPPKDARAKFRSSSPPRSIQTPPSTPPNRSPPRASQTPPTKFRIRPQTPPNQRSQTPPQANKLSRPTNLPSPPTPSRQPKNQLPKTPSPPHPNSSTQQHDKQTYITTRQPLPDLTIRSLRLENSLLRDQLTDTQRSLATADLKLAAAKKDVENWRNLYWRLKGCVSWLFEKAEGVEDEEVGGSESESVGEDWRSESLGEGSEGSVEVAGDAEWPLRVEKKRGPQEERGERRPRRSSRWESMGSLGSIIEEEDEESRWGGWDGR